MFLIVNYCLFYSLIFTFTFTPLIITFVQADLAAFEKIHSSSPSLGQKGPISRFDLMALHMMIPNATTTAATITITPFSSKAYGLSCGWDNTITFKYKRCDVTSLAAKYTYSTKRCVGPDGKLPQKLKNIEPHLIENILNEIMVADTNVRWDDIAGLHQAKQRVIETVMWPMLRPDIFTGCRSSARGLLFFGPPGTGKTMMGKAIAGEAKATFFYISASSVASKWIGDSEKLVRALFGVARCCQPAVIFIDEIDSLLSRRTKNEDAYTRQVKTEFYVGMEGFDSGNEQVLVIGATNRPQDLDEAARRRLAKRFYIPLPCSEARASLIRNLLEKDGLFELSMEDLDSICKSAEGYTGSDMKNLVNDASMGPLREALRQGTNITQLKMKDMRPINLQDFEDAMQVVRSSVCPSELQIYEDWNNQFGCLLSSSK